MGQYDAEFTTIREQLRENPSLKASKLCEEKGLDSKRYYQWQYEKNKRGKRKKQTTALAVSAPILLHAQEVTKSKMVAIVGSPEEIRALLADIL